MFNGNLSGGCNETGFVLFYKLGKVNREKCTKYFRYKKSAPGFSFLQLALTSFVIFAILISIRIGLGNIQDFWKFTNWYDYLLIGFFSCYIGLNLAENIWDVNMKKISQWHSVEHKTRSLLEKKVTEKISLDDLKKAKSVSIRCGSNNFNIIFFACFIFGFFSPVLKFFSNQVIDLASIFPTPIAFVLTLCCIALLMVFIYSGALIVQRVFLLREPTDNQYEAAMVLIKKIQNDIK